MSNKASWGRSTGSPTKRWTLVRNDGDFILRAHGLTRRFHGDDLGQLSVSRHWFRWGLNVSGDTSAWLRGLRVREAEDLIEVLSVWKLRQRLSGGLRALNAWASQVDSVLDQARSSQRWISEEALEHLETARPHVDTVSWFAGAAGKSFEATLSDQEMGAVRLHRADLRAFVATTNEWILNAELLTRKEFFDSVESSPLTNEQARAVVCFDNRVLVIAAAGSGKTSVMVARAAYALERGFIRPERILLLAFNRAAAAELQVRVAQRLGVIGLPSEGIKATTFHAFGLGLIGQATGTKPRLASWLESGSDTGMVSRLIDELREESVEFRLRWDLFRLLYARVSETPDGGDADSYDKTTRVTGFLTANGETVRSEGERVIADWLFHQGVDYEYERPYVHAVADAEHSQYRPDFFYPKIDVWHEHWAVGRDGKPPESFVGYSAAMRWKQELHASYGTTLIETTWGELIDQDGLVKLEKQLVGLGLVLDWNPDRPRSGAAPVKQEELARLVRTFMTHVKSNSLTRAKLQERAADGPAAHRSIRTQMFLWLFWQIHDAWNAKLRAEGCVDFEDMLVLAAEALEAGIAESRYDLVLVDEFQDASRARARLTAALVASPHKYLLAVGDDWQSINRFAGADISVMTRFEEWFGRGPTLRLQKTFRSPQSLCDVASSFVSKNPRQLRKQVVSGSAVTGPAVRIMRLQSTEELPSALEELLKFLAGVARDEPPAAGTTDRRLTVDVLGRYTFDRDVLPRSFPPELNVTFRTVHGSKGLEADYVLLPNVGNGRHGFPSGIIDDPLLDLAMTEPDEFPHAEERRLFYVALTRARRGVALFAVHGKESPFVLELLDSPDVTVVGLEQAPPPRICHVCGEGVLVGRKGPYGEFLGCNRFPRCRGTAQVESDADW